MKRPRIAPPAALDGTEIVLVDVGSRNGVTDLVGLAPLITAFGFEPSSEEFAKLERGVTDLDIAMPGHRPRFRSEKYFPYAITAESGTTQLFILRSIGASSTLRPNPKIVQRFRRHDWRSKFEILRTETVPSRTLRAFVSDAAINRIDYLKLDTQGNEYDILNDAAILAKSGVVKAEVEFVELYENQKLYADIARLMNQHGFVQFDLRFEQIHYRGQNLEVLPGGLLTWADAYFVNERVTDAAAARNQVLILFELGNDDMAFYRARQTGCFSDADLQSVHAWFVESRRLELGPLRRLKKAVERALGIRVSRVAG
jgi:FkbM family methyltransferase